MIPGCFDKGYIFHSIKSVRRISKQHISIFEMYFEQCLLLSETITSHQRSRIRKPCMEWMFLDAMVKKNWGETEHWPWTTPNPDCFICSKSSVRHLVPNRHSGISRIMRVESHFRFCDRNTEHSTRKWRRTCQWRAGLNQVDQCL